MLSSGLLLSLVLATAVVAVSLASSSDRPNIVFILCDDLGHADVSSFALDKPDIPTPGIDSLVKNGIKLTSHYSQEVCSPTRTSILTGRYPIRYGLLHHVYNTGSNFSLFTNETLVTKPLADAGYDSHALGKWHLGMSRWANIPLQRGFKSYHGYLSGEQDYFKHTVSSGGHDGIDYRSGNAPAPVTGEYSTETYSRMAVELIQEYAGKDSSPPFFLYMAYQAVHSPQEVPSHYVDRFNTTIPDETRRGFAGMVAAMDDGIANITNALKETGLWDSTAIILASDNGAPTHAFSSHGGSNYPYRGSKHTLYEGGVRTVGAVSGGIDEIKAAAGSVRDGLVHVTDHFPTMVRIASGKLGLGEGEVYQSPAGFPLDGVDAWDMIVHGVDSHRTEILHNYDPTVKDNPKGTCCGYAGLRSGEWKLLINPGLPDGWYPAGNPNGPSVPPSNDSLVIDTQSTGDSKQVVSLYKISEDPFELHDLSADHPDVVQNLTARLQVYMEEALPMPNDGYWSGFDPDKQPAPNTGYWTPQGPVPNQ